MDERVHAEKSVGRGAGHITGTYLYPQGHDFQGLEPYMPTNLFFLLFMYASIHYITDTPLFTHNHDALLCIAEGAWQGTFPRVAEYRKLC